LNTHPRPITHPITLEIYVVMIHLSDEIVADRSGPCAEALPRCADGTGARSDEASDAMDSQQLPLYGSALNYTRIVSC
jgi:hypothetical protein